MIEPGLTYLHGVGPDGPLPDELHLDELHPEMYTLLGAVGRKP